MFKHGAAALLILAVAGPVDARADEDDAVVDPMRPPAHVPAARARNDAGKPSWSLSAILVSPDRRLAMINNRLVGVGAVVNGARVKSIYGNVVELELNGKSMILRPGTRNVRQISQ